MAILLKDITAVTMDDSQKVIDHAYLAVEGSRISYLGKEMPAGTFDTVIDGRNKVVMPGLVNAHTHVAMTLLRSYADDMNLQDWLFQKIFPFEDTLTPEMVSEGSRVGIEEMLKSGTTCFCDMYFFQKETARAAEEAGIRAVLCEGVTDDVLAVKLQKTDELLEQLNGNQRIKVGISPHAVYTCNPETLKRCAAYAKEHHLFIHTHLSETKVENADCFRDYGMTPAALMEQCGLFELPVVAAHCVHLSKEDKEILQRHQATAVHNPVSNLKLASGVAEITDLVKQGIQVALGTDGASSNNNLNMFEEIKLTGILHKGITGDPTVLPAWEVLKMATVNGAQALGYQDLGMLKEGYLADMIVLDFSAAHLTPNHNTVSNLVYAVQGSDVETTIVDGEIVWNRASRTV